MYATQRLSYCLMEKIQNVSYKDWQRLFERKNNTLATFTQIKRKTNDAMIAFSVVSIIVPIYSLGKRFYCVYSKTTDHEMILPYTKPFTEKMREELIKIWKKSKKYVSDFSALSIDDMEAKKDTNLFWWYESTQ